MTILAPMPINTPIPTLINTPMATPINIPMTMIMGVPMLMPKSINFEEHGEDKMLKHDRHHKGFILVL